MQHVRISAAAAVAALALVAACTGDPADQGLGPQCAAGLDAAQRELKAAKVNGVGDTLTWSRAAGLIAAAKTQQQFSEYQNCVEKTTRARAILRE